MTACPPHPLTPARPTDEYRVEGRMAVRALARELVAADTEVALFADGDLSAPLVTRVVHLEDDRIGFELNGPAPVVDATCRARLLTVVGLPGAVRIQFDVAAPELVPGRTGDGRPADVVVGTLPARGWRIQRRQAFRVVPPRIDRARVVIRLPDGGGELTATVDDLSLGGLSLRWPGPGAPPAIDDGFRHCRIESEAAAPIPCDLLVTRIQPGRDGLHPRISFAFYAMPAEVARFVQMYVMDVERRTR